MKIGKADAGAAPLKRLEQRGEAGEKFQVNHRRYFLFRTSHEAEDIQHQ